MHRFASVALVDARGWILMQERDDHAWIDPDRWGFPGGGLEDGETYEQAAYRELAEETGVRLEGGLIPFGTFTFFSEPCQEHDEFALYVGATAYSDDDIVCGEGRQMVFVDPARLLGLPLTASAALALPELLASDHYATMVA